jgi:AcrR family transcriptional regulator
MRIGASVPEGMTAVAPASKIGYYPTFALPPGTTAPAALEALLRDLWGRRYEELYEDDAGDARAPLPLADAVARVLDFLTEGDSATAQGRLVAMARALALAAEPTAASHAPGDDRPATVLRRVEAALAQGRLQPAADLEAALAAKATPTSQALHESLDTFRSLARALDPSQARAAVEDALDDVLEGYAVFPGSAGRRDLFNWWLTQVVPAAYQQRLPDAIYTMKWPWPPP